MITRKEAILQAAASLFAERGYNETSMAELAKVTGVAQGTIFYHFKNKEELFLAILDDFKTRIVTEFENHVKEKEFSTGLEEIEEALNFYLHIAGAMEDYFRILHRHHAYELARINPICRSHLEAIYGCIVDIFEKAILSGQMDGSIREMSPRKAALMIFTMVDGLVRLNTYDLYDGGVLSSEFFESCRRMLENRVSH